MRPALPLLAVALLCGGDAVAQPQSLDRLKLEYHTGRGAPRAIPGHDNHHAYLFDAVDIKGNRWTGLARVSSPRHGSICLPALKKGEIVPLFGALYRVETAAPELVRLKAAPKGLSVAEDSVVVPLMRDGQGSGQVTYQVKDGPGWNTVFVPEILPGEKGGKPAARVKIDDIRKDAREVRAGDVLKLGPTEWEVRAVVPAENGAIGWVELGEKKGK